MEIVSLAPSNTEILYHLGKIEDVEGVTYLCDYPEEVLKKRRVGGWTNNIDIEKIRVIDPDLVLTSDQLQRETSELLEEKGFNVLHVEPNSLEEVYGSIRVIASTLGCEAKADDLVDDMRSSIRNMTLKNARVYCEEWHNPPMVSGNWIPDMIKAMEGQYPIDKGRSREIDLTRLKEFDPEYIFLNICGAGENISDKLIKERKKWEDITAVKEDNIFVISDSLLNRPGPRLVKGCKKIEEIVNRD